MSAFLEKYGIAIFVLVIVGIMVALASPLGNLVENTIHNEVKKFTNTTVEDYKGGESEKLTNISLNNWEHQLTDGTVADHIDEDINGICDICGCDEIPGLYQPDGLFVSWEQLTSTEYCKLDNGCCIQEQSILTVDENGVLSSAVSDCCLENLSVDHIYGKLVIDNCVTDLGDIFSNGYTYPDKLTGIVLSNNITNIGSWFYECSNLTSVKIPDSVTSIDSSAFSNTSLISVTIPSSVTSINGNAFSGCSNLTSIVVDENNTIYDSRDNCNAIIETSTNTLISGCKNSTIPNDITTIGYRAFSYCTTLSLIEIPNSVINIDEWAFYNCEGLTSIGIPDSVTNIGSKAFYNCSSLTSIVVDENNTMYDSRDNCNAIIETSTNKLLVGSANTVIPNSVTEIGMEAFLNCTGLRFIDIPNSITTINDSTFSGCTNLKSITIPDSVINIESNAFSKCTSLTTVYIPSSVTEIDIVNKFNAPFYGCSSDLKIYCEASEKPSGWDEEWNNYHFSNKLNVTWGITRDVYESTYKQ